MKKIYSLSFVFFIFQLLTSAQPKINLINLNSQSILPYLGNPFYLFGTVEPADANLFVNEHEVEVSEDGSFLCFSEAKILNSENKRGEVPAEYEFRISGTGYDTTIIQKFKITLPPSSNTADDFSVDTTWQNKPDYHISKLSGEKIDVEVKSFTGCSAYFKVEGIEKNIPMIETEFINSNYWGEAVFGSGLTSKGDTINGIYKGHFYLTENLQDAEITVFIRNDQLGEISYSLPGQVSTLSADVHQVVKTLYDPNNLTARYGPGLGYRMFLEEGIKFEVASRYGPWVGLKLNSAQQIYVPQSEVEFLPAGTTVETRNIEVIRTRESKKKIIIDFGFSDRLPVEIFQTVDPIGYKLKFYDVEPNIDWIYFDTNIEEIKDIRYSQSDDKTLEVIIELNQKTQWGYTTKYDGSIFNFVINKAPVKSSGFFFSSNNLEGRRISIDPGHQPESGAVGPRGTKEKEVNFEISLKLKKLLEEAGAEVFLTRQSKEEPLPLRQRRSRVKSFNPELSISIHNNAVPQSVDPIIHNGASVYYYYPQAKPLAELIHQKVVKNLGLKNFGLYWDNLYMCRITEAVSILVEPAFMIVPEQEKLLLTNEFQFKIAESIFDAIDKFYEEYAR